MKEPGPISSDMMVDEIMRKWPATVAVVLSYRMLCVGCPIGPFHSVAEICRAHQVDEDLFIPDLESAVRGQG